MESVRRSLVDELREGVCDNTYIKIVPNRCEIENFPVERYTWPYFAAADIGRDYPFRESHAQGPIRTPPRAFNRAWR